MSKEDQFNLFDGKLSWWVFVTYKWKSLVGGFFWLIAVGIFSWIYPATFEKLYEYRLPVAYLVKVSPYLRLIPALRYINMPWLFLISWHFISSTFRWMTTTYSIGEICLEINRVYFFKSAARHVEHLDFEHIDETRGIHRNILQFILRESGFMDLGTIHLYCPNDSSISSHLPGDLLVFPIHNPHFFYKKIDEGIKKRKKIMTPS